jgi:hypothetical protein
VKKERNVKKMVLFILGIFLSVTPAFSQNAQFIPFSHHSVWTTFSRDNKNLLVFVSKSVFVPIATLVDGAAADADGAIPQSIRNNHYYTESIRLTELARQAYDEGDYDQSSEYAQNAVEYARLSDEYVAKQLKIKATDDAIAQAEAKLDWADTVNASERYPDVYAEARDCFDIALFERGEEHWENAEESARQTVAILSVIQSPTQTLVQLPGQYTVRAWENTKDCLWNIAAMPWSYNDPFKWKILYEANKSILPEPNKPDLIEPGMVLVIPSLKGEIREGMWDKDVIYPKFE